MIKVEIHIGGDKNALFSNHLIYKVSITPFRAKFGIRFVCIKGAFVIGDES